MSPDTNRYVESPRVVLYTRDGCHLCEDALALLRQFGWTVGLKDIDEDEELKKKFSDCIPVVEIDGRIRFRGRVNPILLRRIVTASNQPGE